MVLVDTSVWVGFLREGDPLLSDWLNEGAVLTHSMIIGELRLGNIAKRKQFLSLLENLPMSMHASDDEVTHLIEENKLYGKGIGYVDAHLLVSSMLSAAPLWTLDKRLDAISRKLKPGQPAR